MPRRREDKWPDDDRLEVQAIAMRMGRELERAAGLNLDGKREAVQISLVRLAVMAKDIVKIAREK